MTGGDGDGVHNQSSGQVENLVQIGVSKAPIVVHGSSGQPRGVEAQAELVHTLANEVHSASDKQLRAWGIRGRHALSVSWRTAAEDLFDHWKNINDNGKPVSLAGRFSAILDTFNAVQSKRLVILGKVGAGKTVLAHRLILDLIGAPDAGGAVPVLFSLNDWNPSVDLSRWLADHLARDFDFLNAEESTTRKRQADVFIERGLIMPVLDGFDEIPSCHQSAAIGQISDIDLPLLVTSRPDEYAEAASGTGVIGSAAAIELVDVARTEAREYLRLSANKSDSPEWDVVFDYLERRPHEAVCRNLSNVLVTPLMVMLASAVYKNPRYGHRPNDLLDIVRFPSVDSLEDHLLSSYIETVYANHKGSFKRRFPNPGPDLARKWLGYLAQHLQQRRTHDLTWWHFPATLYRHTRIFVTTATIGPVVALMVGPSAGLTVGIGLAIVVVLIHEAGFFLGRIRRIPERLRLGLPWRDTERRSLLTYIRKFSSGFTNGLAVAFALGFIFGAVAGPVVGSLVGPQSGLVTAPDGGLAVGPTVVSDGGLAVGPTSGAVVGLVVGSTVGLSVGLVASLANGVVSAFGDTYDPHAADPWTLLAGDRKAVLVRAAITTLVGPAVGIAVWLATMYWVEPGPDSPGMPVVVGKATMSSLGPVVAPCVGLTVGLLIGLIRLPFSAWGGWLLFARLWLPLTGRLPWRPRRFLEDANARGVLRTTGAIYQFRHSRLRDYLASNYRDDRNSNPNEAILEK